MGRTRKRGLAAATMVTSPLGNRTILTRSSAGAVLSSLIATFGNDNGGEAQLKQLSLLQERPDRGIQLDAGRGAGSATLRLLREELQLLHEPGSYFGKVVKVMGKNGVLVKVQPESLTLTRTLIYLPFHRHFELHCVGFLHASQNSPEQSRPACIAFDGREGARQHVRDVIELPVKHPELFEALGIAQPKGVLLYRLPGTGKTLLARAVAHHTDCKFIRVSRSEFFVMAWEHAPSIVFMDEIDSIGSSRGESGSGGGDSEVQRTMLEMYGFEPTKNIKAIMATNRIDFLDSALLRPGRIDRKIDFPPPGPEARVSILRTHSRRRGINLRALGEKMGQCSGAEDMYGSGHHVTQEDFEFAVAKVLKNQEGNTSVNKLFS
ncbi:AAA-domain-containing protein [Pleurotus eryngii]|uniref:AAA-domain-containing protein n=1 Tax=Pleurotus eryngii TaxID=5323 RepID=A0A9P5ZVV4_PLEER|nr:AAA-domain-containing protein [Pleurotus eryngii]